jgi:hypothetical protein
MYEAMDKTFQKEAIDKIFRNLMDLSNIPARKQVSDEEVMRVSVKEVCT